MSTARIEVVMDNGPMTGTVFTEEAIAGLVGQRPMLTVDGDWKRPLGRTEVVAAKADGDRVLLTVEVDEQAAKLYGLAPPIGRRLGADLAKDMRSGISLGFIPETHREGDRLLVDAAKALEITPLPIGPVPDAPE